MLIFIVRLPYTNMDPIMFSLFNLQKDREMVRGIPRILTKAGYAIVKSSSSVDLRQAKSN